jgi:parallel beta-helix repeat protein
MRHPIRKSALAGLTALVATGATPATSQVPPRLSCGDTITADTTLETDLVGCPNHGIVIGADGVTLDLGGHVIEGDGEPFEACPPRQPCDLGVFNDGHDGVTVMSGSVHGFDVGVLVAGVRRNRVLRVASSANRAFGFVVTESSRTVIRGSSGDRNPAPDGDGLGIFASHHIRVVDSAFRGNAQLGMHIVGSSRNLIARNHIARNHDMGILMEADRNRLQGNRCVRNGACIIVAPGNGNVIAANRSLRDGQGIAVEKGRANRVARNVVVRPLRDGINVGLEDPPIGGALNVVAGNVVRGSGRDAFSISSHAHRTILRRNVSIAAGDDGFDLADPSARLAGNRARRSADHDFETG